MKGCFALNDKPLVSVIMGIYNCSSTLVDAVMCIQNQTYTNWELIMCDDCSTDDTYKIAKKLSEQDSRIKVIQNQKNLTLAPTLNNCLKKAKGMYCARMDGDDICSYDRVEKEVAFLETHPEYAVVSCCMNMYDENGQYGKAEYPEYPLITHFPLYSPICHAGAMMRTSVLKKLGGYSCSSSVERIEDYDLWIRLYNNGYKAYNIQEYLYSMRDDRNAVKRKKFKYRIKETKLKFKACRMFNLPFGSYLKSLRPVLVGIIPSSIYRYMHIKKYKIR